MHWFLLLIGVFFNSFANILMKAAALQDTTKTQEVFFQPDSVSKVLFNPYMLVGVVSFIIALGAYSYSLKHFDLSIAYPVMTSLGLIIVSVASILLYKEPFSVLKISGMLFILLGVIIVSRS